MVDISPTFMLEKTILRPLVEKDAAAVYSLRSDFDINKYIDRPHCNSELEALIFIQTTLAKMKLNRMFYWAIVSKSNNQLIGTTCLFSFDSNGNTCELGYELLSNFQGKGIMMEVIDQILHFAFDELKLNGVKAYIHYENLASIKLIQKQNFELTTEKDEFNVNLFVYYKKSLAPRILKDFS